MTIKESEQLKVGDRVAWDGDNNDLGTVIDAGHFGVMIKWDNGQVGGIAHGGMEKIARGPTPRVTGPRR
jgi:hypothetical protein